MDTVFLKLLDGARVQNHIGLRMEEGKGYVKGKNYMYLDIPMSEECEAVIKRNQHVFIRAAGTIDVKGRNIVEIEPNAAISEYGQVEAIRRVHPDSGLTQLGVWFTAHKELTVADLGYIVRLYMYS